MGKGSTARYFEDFQAGTRLECAGPRIVSDGDRALWTTFTGDPLPRFASGRIAHPLLTFALVHGQLSREVHGRTEEELGVTNLVVHRPLLIGSTLRATARVVGLREDPDRDTGVVWVRVTGRDGQGVVLSYVTWFRIAKKHRQSRHSRDLLPNLADTVPLSELYTRDQVASPREDTGGRFFFEDYERKELIHHAGVQALGGGEIGRFARWCRQPHAQYADATHERYGAPLSQTVGLAYGLAHDGLEDRMGLGAVNALRTPNAVRDGDLLRAMSQISDIQPLTPLLGAVRIRTFLFRNHVPPEGEAPRITEGRRYLDHVVLDMDYWEVVPTKAAHRR